MSRYGINIESLDGNKCLFETRGNTLRIDYDCPVMDYGLSSAIALRNWLNEAIAEMEKEG